MIIANPQQERAPLEQEESGWDGRAYNCGIYLTCILLGTLFAFLSVFPLARTTYFNRVSRRVFWHAMDYHAHMENQNCDVVIYGDSTAATGIDPLIVEQNTGLKTCNLALPYMALATTGTAILDQYLQHNVPPKLIVFANHARHLRTPSLDEDPGVVDGWLLADRMMPVKDAALLFIRHPRLSWLFAEAVWQQVFTLSPVSQPDPSMRAYHRDLDELVRHHGYFVMPLTEPPEQICSMDLPSSYADPQYLPNLQEKYVTQTTKLLLYASPVRECDRRIGEYQKLTSLLKLDPPMVFATDKFADAWHLNQSGAAVNSARVSELIRTKLALPDRTASALVH